MVAEPGVDVSQACLAAGVLDGIMEEGRDGFVLVGAMLQGYRSDSKQVGQIGCRESFANVAGVDMGGVNHRFFESR